MISCMPCSIPSGRPAIPLLIAAWSLVPTSMASAQIAPAYTIAPVSVPGSNYVAGEAINASVQVAVGSFDGTDTARRFSWTGGVLTAMGDLPGGVGSYANSINAGGTIAGFAVNAAGQRRAVAWTSGGGMLDLGTLGGTESFANGINVHGHVVGLAETADDFRPFFWSQETGMIDLFASGNLGATFGAAYDVNASGIVVGYGEINDDFDANAFAWTLSDGLVNLNSRLVGGAGWSLFGASGINDAGQIVAWGTLDGVATGHVLTPIPSPGAAMVLGLGGLFIVRRRRD